MVKAAKRAEGRDEKGGGTHTHTCTPLHPIGTRTHSSLRTPTLAPLYTEPPQAALDAPALTPPH